jgi:hypothetical protein
MAVNGLVSSLPWAEDKQKTPSAEQVASGSSLEGGEDNSLDHLKPIFEIRIFQGLAVISPER